MENTEDIVREFLKLSPNDIASSEALKEYIEKYSYFAINEESVFTLLMKLLYKEYW